MKKRKNTTIRSTAQDVVELEACKKAMNATTDSGAYKMAVRVFPGQCRAIQQLEFRVQELERDNQKKDLAIEGFTNSFQHLVEMSK